MSTDAEKCKLIAEFEGMYNLACGGPRRGEPHYERVCEHGQVMQHGIAIPGYPHDLNATMRAAQRLPSLTALDLRVNSVIILACIRRQTANGETTAQVTSTDASPARAAFLCIAEYLERGTHA